MIKRNIEQNILKYAKQYPVVVLTGPRQSGKTTLVKKLFKEYQYVNLEDLELRTFAQNDPKGFLKQYDGKVIIDEAQRVPELFSYIQIMADEKKKNGMYILTGSQNFLLMEKINQSLAGRVAILKLLPLSVGELQKAKKISDKTNFSDLMFKGFYPKLYNENVDTEQYYLNYIQTYVERDVRLIKNITNLSQFNRFLTLVASRAGQILNVASLANDCDLNHNTVKDWLSILEASHIIFLLQPHHKNYSKRIMKMPKIYFYDTGLLCSLLGITTAKQLDTHFLKGEVFESFVISDFLKQQYNQAKKETLFFWRDKTGNEIDLIIDANSKIISIEIKSGQTIRQDYFKGLKYYKKLSGIKTEQQFVVYGGDQKQITKDGTVLGWQDINSILK